MAGERAPLPFARVLVTGADGFVGRALVPQLAARLGPGARLVLGVRRPSRDAAAGHERIALDLADEAGVATGVAHVRPDLVVHLAAQASVGQASGAAAATWSTNLGGSLALARAMADSVPGCTMLFASSTEVYGRSFDSGMVDEATPLLPRSVYARSKAAAEAMLADVLAADARLIVARPCNHSGPGQGRSYVVPAFAAQIARAECGGPPVIRVGNLDAERDLLDVRDVVAAYLALLDHAGALPLRSVFNIASGRPIAIRTILDRLRGMSRIDTIVEHDPARMRPSDTARTAIDAAAIARAAGWAPVHAVDDMLAAILAACRRDERSQAEARR